MVYKILQNQDFQNHLCVEWEICVFTQDAHSLYLRTRYMQVLPDTVEPFWQTMTSKQGLFFSVCLQCIVYLCGYNSIGVNAVATEPTDLKVCFFFDRLTLQLTRNL